jgi:hypothetical protein
MISKQRSPVQWHLTTPLPQYHSNMSEETGTLTFLKEDHPDLQPSVLHKVRLPPSDSNTNTNTEQGPHMLFLC